MSIERDAGFTALQGGDVVGAIAQLERATQADPSDFQAFLYLGAAYGQAGRQNDAVTVLTQAVTLQPGNAQARYNLGVAMEQAGWKQEALTALQQAVQLQPSYPKASEAIQRLQRELGVAPPASGLNAAPGMAPAYAPPPQPGYGQAPAYGQPPQPGYAPQPGGYMPPVVYGQSANAAQMNTSGMKGEVPYEIQQMGWSWGGFLLNWIWLIGHNMALFGILLFVGSFIPLVGLIAVIYLGINANKLAWQNRRYESIEQFKAVEKAWTKWGVIIFFAGLLLGLLYVAFIISQAGSGSLPTTGR